MTVTSTGVGAKAFMSRLAGLLLISGLGAFLAFPVQGGLVASLQIWLGFLILLAVPLGVLFHRRFLLTANAVLVLVGAIAIIVIATLAGGYHARQTALFFVLQDAPWIIALSFAFSDLARHWATLRRVHAATARAPAWLQLASAAFLQVAWVIIQLIVVFENRTLYSFAHPLANWLGNTLFAILPILLLSCLIGLVLYQTGRSRPAPELRYSRREYAWFAVMVLLGLLGLFLGALVAIGQWAGGQR